MKRIVEFVEKGISSLDELQQALQLAMQLEFSTVPPYLSAEWSIDLSSDPDNVATTIGGIAEQEMYHFALAGNMLAAINGMPDIANAAFVSPYPTRELPGGIKQDLPVDLKPLSMDQLRVFLQIENPEFPPLAFLTATPAPATIGEFYTRIQEALTALQPNINPRAHFVNKGEATPIRSLDDALKAIARIKEEGEGTQQSPDQAMTTMSLAHYYSFKEILKGNKLKETNGKWSFDGDPVRFPKVLDFQPAPAGSNASVEFNRTLTTLLISLQTCWTTGATPNVGMMYQLRRAGIAIIKQGIRPEFKWDNRS